MRLLTVPNWSFGRSPTLFRSFESILAASPVTVHYLRGDLDHNRTVSALSGEADDLAATLLTLADAAFEVIDLNRHLGVHPRIGALDVLPFIAFRSEDTAPALEFVASLGQTLAEMFSIPVFLYEHSERGRHEADLPTLRKGGFGSLLERELNPDFGPKRVHPRLGATVMGLRDPLIALNVDLRHPMATTAKTIASEIRELRSQGDPTFLGVRALGLPLPSREMSQVSMNLTLPDVTPVDPIIQWVERRALELGVASAGAELIGVIPDRNLEHATRVPFDPAQAVPSTPA